MTRVVAASTRAAPENMLPRQLESLVLRILDGPEPRWDAALDALAAAHPEAADAIRAHAESLKPEFADEHPASTTPFAGDRDPSGDDRGDRDGDGSRPARIGPYRILGVLGEGGMGTVFMAEQRLPVRRRVALKLIKLGMDSRSVVARFEQERQALALMDHDGIARVFDGGTSERGQPYFVMELVNGTPLTDYCDRRQLPLAARLQLLRAVCAGVQHAHQKGVVHRDLKPGNVLVVEDDTGTPRPKILDFGLAKAIAGDLAGATLFTESGHVLGTPEYMAPEQAIGRDVDTRSDVYSLGVMLYELLVGELPFPSEQLRQARFGELQRILSQVDPPKPSSRLAAHDARAAAVALQRGASVGELRRALRTDLDWVVGKALEKDRERRYESVGALAADLQRFLVHEPLLAGPPSAVYRIGKLLRRHRAQFAAAAAVLAASLAGLAVSLMLYARSERFAAHAAVRAGVAGDALKSLVHEVQQQLDKVPGADARAIRERLLRHALTGFDQLRDTLAAGAEVDGASDVDRYDTVDQIATLTGELGESARAAAAREEAIALARARLARLPGDRQALCMLSRSLFNRCLLWRNAGERARSLEVLQEAADCADRALAATTDTAERAGVQHTLALILGMTGRVRSELGVADAIAPQRTAIDMLRALGAERDDDHTITAGLQMALCGLSDGLARAGEWNAALAAAEEAWTLARLQLERHPDEPRAWFDLTAAGVAVAPRRRMNHDLDGALDALEQAVACARRCIAWDDTRTSYQRNLAMALTELAKLRKFRSELPEARAAIEESIRVFDGIDDLDERTTQLNRAVAHLVLAGIENQTKQTGKGLACANTAFAIYRAQLEATPDDDFVRSTFVSALLSWVEIAQAASLPDGEPLLAEAEGQIARIADGESNRFRKRLLHAQALRSRSVLLERDGQRAEAASAVQGFLEVAREMAARDPKDRYWPWMIHAEEARLRELTR